MTEMPENTTALPPTPPPQVTPPEKGSKTNYHNGTIGDCLVLPSAKNCWQNSWVHQPEW